MKTQRILVVCLFSFLTLCVYTNAGYHCISDDKGKITVVDKRGVKQGEILDTLIAKPKYKCLFHDSFARENISCGDNNDTLHVCTASLDNLGNNYYDCFANVGLSYHEYSSKGHASMAVGVKSVQVIPEGKEYVATNSKVKGKKQTVIKYVDVGTSKCCIIYKKGPSSKAVAKIAFWVIDINNYCYLRHYKNTIDIVKVVNGKERKIKKIHNVRTNLIVIDIDNVLSVYSDDCCVGEVILGDVMNSNQYGMLFTSNEITEISSFVIEEKDTFALCPLNLSFDSKHRLQKKGKSYFMDAEENTICVEDGGILRFSLEYTPNYSERLISNSRRSEFVLFGEEAPLDSWVASFDVLFPGKSVSEHFEKDKYHENFFQAHDRNAGYGLSPQFVIRVMNDNIICNLRSREILKWNNEDVLDREFVIAKLVDSNNHSNGLMSLRKGEWHNFTVYVKEGYLVEHNPRTIVFIDCVKVLDDSLLNAYNAGGFGSYLKFGIYKPAWKTDNLNSKVKKRVLYMKDIQYYR